LATSSADRIGWPAERRFDFHGIAWFALLVSQPALVDMGRTDLHRLLGRIGAALAVAVIVVGAVGALIAARRTGGFVGNPMLFVALTDLFLVSLAIRDLKTRGKLHPVTLWAGLLLIVSQPLRFWLSGTHAWLQFISRVL
jgi:hypothetical protein